MGAGMVSIPYPHPISANSGKYFHLSMGSIEAFNMMYDLEYITHSRNECSCITSYDMADCILGNHAIGMGSIRKYHTSATLASNLIMTVDDLPAMQDNDYITAIVCIWYRDPESSAPSIYECYSTTGPIVYGTTANIPVPNLTMTNNLQCIINWSTSPLRISLGFHETREGAWNFDLYVLQ